MLFKKFLDNVDIDTSAVTGTPEPSTEQKYVQIYVTNDKLFDEIEKVKSESTGDADTGNDELEIMNLISEYETQQNGESDLPSNNQTDMMYGVRLTTLLLQRIMAYQKQSLHGSEKNKLEDEVKSKMLIRSEYQSKLEEANDELAAAEANADESNDGTTTHDSDSGNDNIITARKKVVDIKEALAENEKQ